MSKIGNIFTDQYKMVGKNKSGGENKDDSLHRENEGYDQVKIGNEQQEERSELVQEEREPIEVDDSQEVKSKMSSKEKKEQLLMVKEQKKVKLEQAARSFHACEHANLR